MEQPQKDALLEKYKRYGEDHPSYQKLKEAVLRGQDDVIAQAVAELEALKEPAKGSAQAAAPARRSYPVWSFFWVIFLTGGLYLVTTVFFNQRVAAVLESIPPGSTNEFILSEMLGGPKAPQAYARLVTELHALQPDNILFVGHQLAKREVVEFLSTLAGVARVDVLLGPDEAGKCQIADKNSPLLRYQFTELRESAVPIRTQVLLAFNNESKRALAVVGTCPYDLQDAENGEHILIILHDFNECSDLFEYYSRLWEAGKRRR